MFSSVFGYNESHWSQLSFYSVLSAEEREKLTHEIEHLMLSGRDGPIEQNLHVLTVNGVMIPCCVIISVLRRDGKLLGLMLEFDRQRGGGQVPEGGRIADFADSVVDAFGVFDVMQTSGGES